MKEEATKESTKTWLEVRGYKDPHRTCTLFFKFCIWLYRKTGIFLSYLRETQDYFIRDNANQIYENFVNGKQDYNYDFSAFLGCEIGCWQAYHRMARPYSSRMMKLRFRIKWFLRKHRIM